MAMSRLELYTVLCVVAAVTLSVSNFGMTGMSDNLLVFLQPGRQVGFQRTGSHVQAGFSFFFGGGGEREIQTPPHLRLITESIFLLVTGITLIQYFNQ